MTAQIIQFPKGKGGIPPQSLEEIQNQVETNKKKFADKVIAGVAQELYDNLAKEGFDTQNRKSIKDMAMLVETIRATLYRCHGLSHPIQEYSDENFFMSKDEDGDESVEYKLRDQT